MPLSENQKAVAEGKRLTVKMLLEEGFDYQVISDILRTSVQTVRQMAYNIRKEEQEHDDGN